MNAISSFSLTSSTGQFSGASSFEEPICYYRQYRDTDSEDVEFLEMNDEDENGNNALMFAVCQGREDLTRTLVDQGAFLDHQNLQGETALYWACSEGVKTFVDLLLENGANPNIKTLDGASPLHAAAANGHSAIISTLITYGAFVNAQDEEMDSVLHYAVRECRVGIVEMLVKNFTARLDVKNEDLETPLDLALCLESNSFGQQQEYSSIVKILSGNGIGHGFGDRLESGNIPMGGSFSRAQAHMVY